MEATFYIASAIAVLATIMVITRYNMVHALIYLIISFLAISIVLFVLGAPFIAALEIIIYAGASVVLIIFVIMMLNLNKETEPHKPAWIQISAVIAGGVLMLTLVGALKGASAMGLPGNVNADIGLTRNLGRVLFTDFLVPFELSSVLFLAAMVGAVLLGKKQAQ